MRRLAFLISFVLAGGFSIGSSRPSEAAGSVNVSVSFGDALAPYGDWVQHARFGIVWSPRHVDHAWRPYTHGRWVYTDYDWTWVSEEEWGWATEHYGRWYLDPDEGWIWIPGDEWAPAWVAWRNGGGYVGWAPLPPEVDVFNSGFELRVDPLAYAFVEERYLLEPTIYRRCVPVARNVTYVGVTRNVTRYTRVDNRIVNRGLDIQLVARFTGRAVPRARINEVASASQARVRVQGGVVPVFRPRVAGFRPEVAVERRLDAGARHGVTARQQEQERQRLQSAERRERDQLRRIQQREEKRPPARAEHETEARTREQVRERHQVEQRAQEAHEQRESKLLQQRQERERRAAPPQEENRKGKSDKKPRKDANPH